MSETVKWTDPTAARGEISELGGAAMVPSSSGSRGVTNVASQGRSPSLDAVDDRLRTLA
jgi:hypothetical protein